MINLNPVKGMVSSVVRTGGDVLLQGAKTLLNANEQRGGRSRDAEQESGWDDDDIDFDEYLTPQDGEIEAELSKNIAIMKESYPMFYFSEKEYGSPFFNNSSYGTKYDSFSDSSTTLHIRSNPSLELCMILDKMWHLERVVLGERESGQRNGGGN